MAFPLVIGSGFGLAQLMRQGVWKRTFLDEPKKNRLRWHLPTAALLRVVSRGTRHAPGDGSLR
jgi:hypothetical protein